MKALPWIVSGDLIEDNLTRDPASGGELITRLAIKLREDLRDLEEKLSDREEFAQVMNSASALILAIIDPEQFLLPASSPKIAAQSILRPAVRRSIPSSLH